MSQKLTFIIDRRLDMEMSTVLAKRSAKLTKLIDKFLFPAKEMCETNSCTGVVWPRIAFVNRRKLVL